MVYTVRVAFEVMVLFCIGVYYPKLSLNCNTYASHSTNEWDANVNIYNYINLKNESTQNAQGGYPRILREKVCALCALSFLVVISSPFPS